MCLQVRSCPIIHNNSHINKNQACLCQCLCPRDRRGAQRDARIPPQIPDIRNKLKMWPGRIMIRPHPRINGLVVKTTEHTLGPDLETCEARKTVVEKGEDSVSLAHLFHAGRITSSTAWFHVEAFPPHALECTVCYRGCTAEEMTGKKWKPWREKYGGEGCEVVKAAKQINSNVWWSSYWQSNAYSKFRRYLQHPLLILAYCNHSSCWESSRNTIAEIQIIGGLCFTPLLLGYRPSWCPLLLSDNNNHGEESVITLGDDTVEWGNVLLIASLDSATKSRVEEVETASFHTHLKVLCQQSNNEDFMRTSLRTVLLLGRCSSNFLIVLLCNF